MRKKIILLVLGMYLTNLCFSQLMVSKMLGKNSSNSKLGFGTFFYYDIALRNNENNSIRLEFMDLAYYPRKDQYIDCPIGYLSIKLGYKHVFSETKEGFYVEPQIGYCQTTVSAKMVDKSPNGNALALALESGYNLEVGQRGNIINFGLKYENDISSTPDYSLSSLGFRIAYSFHLFGSKD
jgi:hypothetical protein